MASVVHYVMFNHSWATYTNYFTVSGYFSSTPQLSQVIPKIVARGADTIGAGLGPCNEVVVGEEERVGGGV